MIDAFYSWHVICIALRWAEFADYMEIFAAEWQSLPGGMVFALRNA